MHTVTHIPRDIHKECRKMDYLNGEPCGKLSSAERYIGAKNRQEASHKCFSNCQNHFQSIPCLNYHGEQSNPSSIEMLNVVSSLGVCCSQDCLWTWATTILF